jgi:hypothetical protein
LQARGVRSVPRWRAGGGTSLVACGCVERGLVLARSSSVANLALTATMSTFAPFGRKTTGRAPHSLTFYVTIRP